MQRGIITKRLLTLRNWRFRVVAQFGQIHHTGVILKDLARTAAIAVGVHIRYALDPSQAQDDSIPR
jgi:hypothetical protein